MFAAGQSAKVAQEDQQHMLSTVNDIRQANGNAFYGLQGEIGSRLTVFEFHFWLRVLCILVYQMCARPRPAAAES